MMNKMLITGFLLAAGQVQAATEYECIMYKLCEPRVECVDADFSMSATASNNELRIGPADDVLVLGRVMGDIGDGITYADVESPDTYNVITLRPDGEMYLSSHKNTPYGGLSTMYLRCKVK